MKAVLQGRHNRCRLVTLSRLWVALLFQFHRVTIAQEIGRSGSVIYDEGAGTAPIPDLTAIMGCAGALWAGYVALRDGGGLWNVLGMAWLGFWSGILLGLPIAMLLR